MQKLFMTTILTTCITIMFQKKKTTIQGILTKHHMKCGLPMQPPPLIYFGLVTNFPQRALPCGGLGSEDQRMWKYYNRN